MRIGKRFSLGLGVLLLLLIMISVWSLRGIWAYIRLPFTTNN